MRVRVCVCVYIYMCDCVYMCACVYVPRGTGGITSAGIPVIALAANSSCQQRGYLLQ
jgi:hypothetical protein